MQESIDDVPTDYIQLFNQNLYSVNMDCVPQVLQAYEELGVKHEPLRLIPPQFESPLPPLQAAVSTFIYFVNKQNRRICIEFCYSSLLHVVILLSIVD